VSQWLQRTGIFSLSVGIDELENETRVPEPEHPTLSDDKVSGHYEGNHYSSLNAYSAQWLKLALYDLTFDILDLLSFNHQIKCAYTTRSVQSL
jgi:hypothetical protein